MADVRSMLRSEQAARRVTHPHAAYSSSGQLSCSVCRVVLKSDALWDAHVRSSQHLTRVKEAESIATLADGAKISAGRKRKASEDDDDDSERKKSKNEETPDSELAEVEEEHNGEAADADHAQKNGFTSKHSTQPDQNQAFTEDQEVDEDEWAAFQRDMEQLDRQQQQAAANPSAPIEPTPVSTAELEAQTQNRTSGEVEVEDERDEAARELQDEFDEMNELEQRVQRLKDKREALKQARKPVDGVEDDVEDEAPGSEAQNENESEEDSEEDEDDDEWTVWGLGR